MNELLIWIISKHRPTNFNTRLHFQVSTHVASRGLNDIRYFQDIVRFLADIAEPHNFIPNSLTSFLSFLPDIAQYNERFLTDIVIFHQIP